MSGALAKDLAAHSALHPRANTSRHQQLSSHAVHGDLDAIRRSMAAGDQLVMESAFNDHSPDLHDWIAENSLSPNLFEIAPSVTSVQAGAAKRSHQVGWRWRLTDPLGSYVSVPIPASCRVSACRATDWSFGRGRF